MVRHGCACTKGPRAARLSSCIAQTATSSKRILMGGTPVLAGKFLYRRRQC